MSSLTSPLDLRSHQTQPDRSLDVVAVINVIVLALCFLFLSSRFIFAPGLTIDLPSTIQKPIPGTSSVAVLTINQDNMFIFDGRIHTLESLKPVMHQYIPKKGEETILLVRASKNVTIQTLLNACDIAQLAGFSHVQLAADSEETPQGILTPNPSRP